MYSCNAQAGREPRRSPATSHEGRDVEAVLRDPMRAATLAQFCGGGGVLVLGNACGC